MEKKLSTMGITFLLVSLSVIVLLPEPVNAGSYDGNDLAVALLVNSSTLISSSYWDRDTAGHRQAVALSSRGNLIPTHGPTYVWMTTGRADLVAATTDGLDPGNERGNWFAGGQYGNPRDEANLQLQLQVPDFMHYLYYDVQFFTVEYPDYIGTQYNDQLTITVDSPHEGVSSYVINVNGGDFVLNALDPPLVGTGYDLFATSGNPDNVDWVSTTPHPTAADAGASALVGREHPVHPGEIITITFNIRDVGDNQFDSAAFLDNLQFSGFAKTEMLARLTAQDLNGGNHEPEDEIKYFVTISNIGTAAQNDNPGYEFENTIPLKTQYVSESATASSGTITYDPIENKIFWDGSIPAQSSVILTYTVTIDTGLVNGTQISNQGTVHWDSDEDGTNDADELTDDPAVNDGIDQDGDGETGDDDPTIIRIISYKAPTVLWENFTTDTPGGKAQQTHEGQLWFETSTYSGEGNFEVAGSYYKTDINSFKTKLRSSHPTQYWNYSFAAFNSEVTAWDINFSCGHNSEPADLYLRFSTAAGNDIAHIRFDYVFVNNVHFLSRYQVQLSVKTPTGWMPLQSDSPNGYLYNGWYRLRIERNGETSLNYTLFRYDGGDVVTTDTATGPTLGQSLSNLACVKFYSTENPVVCPIVFWDKHSVSLVSSP
ncbi:MAG: choice-of-anchor L domain-containing protein [Candidatus Thermoplasmatota archaeon]|nr:choice-of-anchor L domain-containing protein [Candidatus Thermoplasmatota archaeon]